MVVSASNDEAHKDFVNSLTSSKQHKDTFPPSQRIYVSIVTMRVVSFFFIN